MCRYCGQKLCPSKVVNSDDFTGRKQSRTYSCAGYLVSLESAKLSKLIYIYNTNNLRRFDLSNLKSVGKSSDSFFIKSTRTNPSNRLYISAALDTCRSDQCSVNWTVGRPSFNISILSPIFMYIESIRFKCHSFWESHILSCKCSCRTQSTNTTV